MRFIYTLISLVLLGTSSNVFAYYNCTIASATCEAQAIQNNIAFPEYPDYCINNILIGEIQLYISPENIVTNTYYCELVTAPNDYECDSPKEWVYTLDYDWRCTDTTLIPETNTPNIAGIYGVLDNYHTGTFNSEECDLDIPYECIIPNCEFWNPLSLVNALCK
jgi:hypothetical protein